MTEESHKKVLVIGDDWETSICDFSSETFPDLDIMEFWDAEEAIYNLRKYLPSRQMRLSELLKESGSSTLDEVTDKELLAFWYGKERLHYTEGNEYPQLINFNTQDPKWDYFQIGGIYAGSFVVKEDASQELYSRPEFHPSSDVGEKYFGLELTDHGFLSVIDVDETMKVFPTSMLSFDALLLDGQWNERDNEDMDAVLLWQEIIRKMLLEIPPETPFATIDCALYK